MNSVMTGMIKVSRQEAILVTPAIPTETEVKEVSDIDDQLRFQSHVIMSYKGKQSVAKKDPAKVIKEALAKTLVYYYPFAGRLRQGANRKLMVECNGEGVLFIEADAEATLQEIQSQILPPCPLLEHFIYDVPGSNGITHAPLLLFQVTRLLCGGYIVGIQVNHSMCDALGLAQLLKALAEISRGAPKPSVMPLWERERLIARNSPRVTYTYHQCQEVDDIYNKQGLQVAGGNIFVQGCFYFEPNHIQAIRNLLPPQLQHSCSTFELLCAFLWRCRTLALQPNLEETIKFSMYVNIRGKDFMQLPSGYYGNAAVSPEVATKAKDLVRENSLPYALRLVMDSKTKVTEEHVRSMIMAANGRPSPTYSVHSLWKTSNLVHLGLEAVDFGWGTPSYCGLPIVHDSLTTLMARLRNDRGEEIRTAVMCLPEQAMLRLQQVVGEIIGEPFKCLRIKQSRAEKSKL